MRYMVPSIAIQCRSGKNWAISRRVQYIAMPTVNGGHIYKSHCNYLSTTIFLLELQQLSSSLLRLVANDGWSCEQVKWMVSPAAMPSSLMVRCSWRVTPCTASCTSSTVASMKFQLLSIWCFSLKIVVWLLIVTCECKLYCVQVMLMGISCSWIVVCGCAVAIFCIAGALRSGWHIGSTIPVSNRLFVVYEISPQSWKLCGVLNESRDDERVREGRDIVNVE